MQINSKGLELIKSFEGCILHAYKPVAQEQYYTIGYGHYGEDVQANATITQAQADSLLVQDIQKYENEVNTLGINLNSNQFSALVSFCYNCGAGSLRTLVHNRNNAEIAEALLMYVNGASGRLEGLVRRRQAERTLFLTPCNSNTVQANNHLRDFQSAYNRIYSKNIAVDGLWGSQSESATHICLKNYCCNDLVAWVQIRIGANVDGKFGHQTENKVIEYQKAHGLGADGIVGTNTIKAILRQYGVNC